eukprot:352387-Prorocentrum_minimum.AAC.1
MMAIVRHAVRLAWTREALGGASCTPCTRGELRALRLIVRAWNGAASDSIMVEDGSDVHAVETDGSFDGSIFLANIRCNPTPTRIDSADYDRRAKNRSIRVSRHSLATWHTHMQVTQSVVQWFSVSKLEVPQVQLQNISPLQSNSLQFQFRNSGCGGFP